MFVSGQFFGLITTRLIISNAIDGPVTLFHPEIILVIIPCLFSLFNNSNEETYNFACHIATLLLGLLLFAICVIYSIIVVNQIAWHLKIRVFKVKSKSNYEIHLLNMPEKQIKNNNLT